MMRYILLTILLLISVTAAAITVYKWTDQNGATVFSDQPREGATAVQLPSAPTPDQSTPSSSAPPAQKTMHGPNKGNNSNSQEKEGYEQISIVVPQDGETVRDNSGNMQVTIALKPTLRKGDSIQLLIDGKPVGSPQPTTNFQVTALERGEHTLTANVLDSSGAVLLKSNGVKFFMHQAHITSSGRISS